jgi:hypothetical protein
MGKNELSAQIEAYLMSLYSKEGATIVKAAPSFKPQLVNSILRLKSTLADSPLTETRWRARFGYMLDIGKARTMFLSADPKASVVGATSSLLLELDEAQDADTENYNRSFRPMAASTNATTVLYGTAWNDHSLLEQQRQTNKDNDRRTGERTNFEYDWRILAALSPNYKAFVETEIERMGIDHPAIQTQYFLVALSDAGTLFSAAQRELLQGTHPRQLTPAAPDQQILFAIDVGGEDEESEDAHSRGLVPRRDSTVLTIGAMVPTPDGRLATHVVNHVWWSGKQYDDQAHQLLQLAEIWNPIRWCIDSSGIGAHLASIIEKRYTDRVDRVAFTQATKSQLGFELLAQVNTRRLQIYSSDASPDYRELWTQIAACRYRLRAQNQMQWEVPANQGHDDFVVSLALLARAAAAALPAPQSGLVRSIPYEADAAW